MKKIAGFLILFAVLVFSTTTISSCNRKTGCPINENASAKTDKNGQFSAKKRGNSNLFPKDMRKKKKKN